MTENKYTNITTNLNTLNPDELAQLTADFLNTRVSLKSSRDILSGLDFRAGLNVVIPTLKAKGGKHINPKSIFKAEKSGHAKGFTGLMAKAENVEKPIDIYFFIWLAVPSGDYMRTRFLCQILAEGWSINGYEIVNDELSICVTPATKFVTDRGLQKTLETLDNIIHAYKSHETGFLGIYADIFTDFYGNAHDWHKEVKEAHKHEETLRGDKLERKQKREKGNK